MGVWPVLQMQALTLADHAETTIIYAALQHIWQEVRRNASWRKP
jgi:hypothetical protein